MPINKCFDKTFEGQLKDAFSPQRVKDRGIFNYEYIDRLIRNRRQNPFLFDRQLFALLTLELWFELFIDKR